MELKSEILIYKTRLFETGELEEVATIKDFLIVQKEGKRRPTCLRRI